ncbi:MAG: MucBP domain-containing protein [Lachnospiraceae bacterium]|nr:MucBP domain-containing protein [Lachnospiraceae bacterium]
MEKYKRIFPFRKFSKGRKLKKGMGILLAVALLFNTLPSCQMTAAASEEGTISPIAEAVSYRDCDASGQNWEEKSCETYTEVMSDTTTWNDGWYVVIGDVTINSRITVNGNVHLILTDGCSLETQGITVNSSDSLSIYAQSGGTGSLTATASGEAAGIGGSGLNKDGGTITITGGNITAANSGKGPGIGGGNNASDVTVTIHGGNVNATGGDFNPGIGGIYGGTITITGGTVTATGFYATRGTLNITGGTLNGKAYYKVTFVADTEIVTIPDQGIAQDAKAARPGDPNGYVLSFFTDASYTMPFDFDIPVTQNTTIYVKCEVNNNCIASVTTGGFEKLYTSPDSFVNAIKSTSGEVDAKLLQNVDLGSLELLVPSDMTLTMDCGEWTLSGSGVATVTIDGTFNFTGGTLLNSSKIGITVDVWQNGKFNMSGGLVDRTGDSGNFAVSTSYTGANVTITGGSIGVKGNGLFVSNYNTATLSGGTYSSIYAPENTVANIVKEGYALQGTDGLIRRDTSTATKLSNVTVVECPHTGDVTDNNDGTHSGECPYCGTAVEKEFHTLGPDNVCEGCNAALKVKVEIGNDTTYYGDIDAAWEAALGVGTATITLLDHVTTEYIYCVDSGNNITFNGGSFTYNSLYGVFSVGNAQLTINNGTFIAAEGTALDVVTGSTVTLNGGTFTGGSRGAAVLCSNDPVSGFLPQGYAYFDEEGPIALKEDQKYLSGTVTVQECNHIGEGICEYQQVDTTTHKITCLACGFTGTMECTYDDNDKSVSNGDGTHTLTCAGCGSTKTEDCSGGTASYTEKAICAVCGGTYGEVLKDAGAPTGEISISANKWNSFLNMIAFGLFFKKTEQVTITAQDQESGVASVSYYISDSELSEEGVKALTTEWTAINAATVTFGISEDVSCVVYAKITDNQGNVTYISSDGMVFDGTLPSITGVTDRETYCTPQTVMVTDDNLESVTVNGKEETLPDGEKTLSFTLDTASGTQTIKATDKAGNITTVTVYMEHHYGTEWKSDSESHWHECVCGDKSDTAAHTEDNGSVTKPATGIMTYRCSVCGYEMRTAEIKGRVIVRYVDESENEIETSITLTGIVGEDYETAEANIAGYALKTSPANAKGKYTEEDITVTYVYQKNQVTEKTAKVIVRYVNESDKEIKASNTLTGIVGADYETAEAEIEGYTLKTSPVNAKGKYTEEDITVTYVYQKNQVTEKTGKVIVRYVDESDKEIKVSTTLTGTVGVDYETAEAEIEGYTLKTSPANAKGKYTEEDITVTFVYSKNTTPEYKKVSITSFKMSKASNSITTGQTVRMTAKATGGGGELKYQFVVKLGNGKNQAVRKYSSDNSCQWLPTQSGKYTLYVYVKDSSTGKVVKKSIKNYNVKPALKIKSFTQSRKSGTAVVGDKVIVRVNATGGIGKKSYRYYYKLNGKKYILKENTTSKKVNWTPKKAGKYQLFIEVMDDMDNKITKKVNYVVVDKLKVKSLKANASSVKAGQEVKLSAAATGGTKGYSYKFTYEYKNKSVTINNYSSLSSVMWTPKYKGKYKITVYIKDAKNRKATKTMTLNVK